MTIKALYKLVGKDFLYAMTPLDVKDKKGNRGVIEFVEGDDIEISFDEQEFWAGPDDWGKYSFWSNREVIEMFWRVADTNEPIKPSK